MKLLAVRPVHKGNYISMYDAVYRTQNGNIKTYEMVSRKHTLDTNNFGPIKDEHQIEAVGILAFNNSNHDLVLLQKEFRMACNNWVYELPGGLMDSGETLEEAASRELKEETGFDLVKVHKVMRPAYTAVGVSDELVSTIICTASGNKAESTSEFEEIEGAGWYSKEQVKVLLESAYMSLRTQSLLLCWAYNGDVLNLDK